MRKAWMPSVDFLRVRGAERSSGAAIVGVAGDEDHGLVVSREAEGRVLIEYREEPSTEPNTSGKDGRGLGYWTLLVRTLGDRS